MSFNGITIYYDKLNVSSNKIEIVNVSYVASGFQINFTGILNWSRNNAHIDSGEYPKLIYSDNSFKNISSNLQFPMNATFFIFIENYITCDQILNITYRTVSGNVSLYQGATINQLCSDTSQYTRINIYNLTIEPNSSIFNSLVIGYNTTYFNPSSVNLLYSQCEILDIRCIFVNEIAGSAILATIIAMIIYFIVAYKLRFDFNTTMFFFIPMLLFGGLMFVGFSVIFAFVTFVIGLMVAWAINRIINN